jgi:hypothetical protein
MKTKLERISKNLSGGVPTYSDGKPGYKRDTDLGGGGSK